MTWETFYKRREDISKSLCKAMSDVIYSAFIRDLNDRLNSMDTSKEKLTEVHVEMQKLMDELFKENEKYEREISELRGL